MSEPSQTPSLSAAAERLSDAVRALDSALDPVLARLSRAEARAQDAEQRVGASEDSAKDRARLATELDAAIARAQQAENAQEARETEFAQLSADTRAELDATIATLRDVLRGAA